jgi:hypothetical protein
MENNFQTVRKIKLHKEVKDASFKGLCVSQGVFRKINHTSYSERELNQRNLFSGYLDI